MPARNVQQFLRLGRRFWAGYSEKPFTFDKYGRSASCSTVGQSMSSQLVSRHLLDELFISLVITHIHVSAKFAQTWSRARRQKIDRRELVEQVKLVAQSVARDSDWDGAQNVVDGMFSVAATKSFNLRLGNR